MIHLFDSNGDWVAWKRLADDRFLWGTEGDWIGWFPWGDDDAVDPEGNYLGTIVQGNRLLHRDYQPYRGYPGYPGYPGYAGYPGYPGFAGYCSLPSGYSDVPKERLKP